MSFRAVSCLSRALCDCSSIPFQVLDEYSVVLADEPRCEFVLIVQHFSPDVALDLGDLFALFLVVVRAVFFPREFALLAAQSFVLVFEVKPIHGLPVASVDVVLNAKVDTHAIARNKRVQCGFLRNVSVVGFETERYEPLASPFLFERDLFDRGVVGEWTVVADFHPADFAESHVGASVLAPLVIEVEA